MSNATTKTNIRTRITLLAVLLAAGVSTVHANPVKIAFVKKEAPASFDPKIGIA